VPAPTLTLADSPPAEDLAATLPATAVPSAAQPLALAELLLAQPATLLTVHTDTLAESPPVLPDGAATLCTPLLLAATDTAEAHAATLPDTPLPSPALPDSAQDATLARMISAPTTPSPQSPSAPPLLTLYHLLQRRDLCPSEELAAITSVPPHADSE